MPATPSNSKLRIKVLGTLALYHADFGTIGLPGRKAKALFAYLALNADRPQARETLAALLWGNRFDAQARQSLRQCIAQLRKALGGLAPRILAIDGKQVTFQSHAAAIDLRQFEQFAAAASPAALSESAKLFEAELLDGLDVDQTEFEGWLRPERAKYRELAYSVMARLGDQAEGAGDWDQAFVCAERMLELEPLSEDGHRRLMRFYAEAGRRTAALVQYGKCADRLRRELDVAPAAETTRLFADIQNGEELAARSAIAPSEMEAPPALRGKPAILVAPFQSIAGDRADQVLADGITDAIIANLSRSSHLLVISRHTAFQYRQSAVDIRD